MQLWQSAASMAHKHIHTHTHIHIYIYIYVCVCAEGTNRTYLHTFDPPNCSSHQNLISSPYLTGPSLAKPLLYIPSLELNLQSHKRATLGPLNSLACALACVRAREPRTLGILNSLAHACAHVCAHVCAQLEFVALCQMLIQFHGKCFRPSASDMSGK